MELTREQVSKEILDFLSSDEVREKYGTFYIKSNYEDRTVITNKVDGCDFHYKIIIHFNDNVEPGHFISNFLIVNSIEDKLYTDISNMHDKINDFSDTVKKYISLGEFYSSKLIFNI